jgi:hypothetical protein
MREEAMEQGADDRGVADAGAIRKAWGHYLQRFLWTHVLTLTYKHEVSPERASRDFVDGFIRRAAFEAAQPVRWFYVLEGGDDAGRRLHIHALVSGTAHLPIARLERAWRGGITDIRVYDPARGGAAYLTKTLYTAREDWYDHSGKLPSLRVPPLPDNCGVSQMISQYPAA